jgi:hypothetical protein
VIREIALLAHTTDNNATTGPAFKALFPNGLEAELRPLGAAQVVAAATLRERLDSQPAATKVKAQVMDSLYFDEAPSSRSSSDDKGGDTPTPRTPATDTKPK